jgi:hypothetical protein
MSNNLSASEQIEELERQIVQLKHRSLLELKVKLAEARHTVVVLEKQIEEITGKAPASGGAEPKQRKARTSITIAQVVAAIKGGATNYKAVAGVLGCSPITVAKKIEAEGKANGIKSTGQKATFKLLVK